MKLESAWRLISLVVPRGREDRTGLPNPDANRFYCSGCNGLVDSRFYDRRMF